MFPLFFSSLAGYPWIGFHDPNNNDTYVWLNGNLLPDNDENWQRGKAYLTKYKQRNEPEWNLN